MKCLRESRGVTLVELLFTVSIASILTTLSVASYSSLFARNGIEEGRDAIILALRHARFSAVNNNRRVILCPTEDMKTCLNRSNWNKAWMIFEDYNYDNKCKSVDGVSCDDGGQILSIRTKLMNQPYKVSKNNALKRYVRFNPVGEALGYPCTFTLCSSDDEVKPLGVIVSMVGRVRKADQYDKLRCD